MFEAGRSANLTDAQNDAVDELIETLFKGIDNPKVRCPGVGVVRASFEIAIIEGKDIEAATLAATLRWSDSLMGNPKGGA